MDGWEPCVSAALLPYAVGAVELYLWTTGYLGQSGPSVGGCSAPKGASVGRKAAAQYAGPRGFTSREDRCWSGKTAGGNRFRRTRFGWRRSALTRGTRRTERSRSGLRSQRRRLRRIHWRAYLQQAEFLRCGDCRRCGTADADLPFLQDNDR